MNKKTNPINGWKRREPDDLRRVARLIDALMDEELDPGLRAKMQEWFTSPDSDAEKQQAFVDYAAKAKPHKGPMSAEALGRYKKLASRMGFPEGRKMVLSKRRGYTVLWRAAAVLIPIVAISGAYMAGWFGPGTGQDINTTVVAENRIAVRAVEGVQKDITLPDNSEVWVNSGSAITYPEEFSGKERLVQLEGEAYFNVEKDTGKPFVVQTEMLQVRVLGTQFEVKAYPEAQTTEVTLFSGLVEVTAGEKSERLDPGQRLTYHHDSGRIEIEQVETQREADWRSEVVYAKNRTLAELFRMIANYYDVEIVFDEADFAGGELYDSAFGREQEPERIVGSLSLLSGAFGYTVENGRIVIEKR